MPIYEYECRKCGVFEHEQPISARPLGRCPRCRSKVTKLISATAFHLKGGGWYADGYGNKKSGAEAAAKPESKTEASTAEPPASAADTSSPAPKKADSPGKKKGTKASPAGKSAAA